MDLMAPVNEDALMTVWCFVHITYMNCYGYILELLIVIGWSMQNCIAVNFKQLISMISNLKNLNKDILLQHFKTCEFNQYSTFVEKMH